MSDIDENEIEAAVPAVIEDCERCGKPVTLCVCQDIEPIDNRIALLILQHPQEQDKALGTARLTALSFKKAVFKTGPLLAEPDQGARPHRRPETLGDALSGVRRSGTAGTGPKHRGA